MEQFKDKHLGERCFILGNGPSLKDVDFSLLEGEIIFGTNGIFDNPWGLVPDYYVSVNPLVLKQFSEEIGALNTTKFVPKTVKFTDIVSKGEFVYIDTSLGRPMFQRDLTQPMWEGYTVTFVCLQLAYWMGFEEVVLLGLDHYYGMVEEPNKEVIAAGKDPWHFRDDYFSNGTKWNLPDLKMSELAYSLASRAYQQDGRNIYNCSSKTACPVFETMPLQHFLSLWIPTVSAIVSAYYAEEFLEGCVEDLHNQTLRPEIVVVCQEGSREHKIAKEQLGEIADKIVTTPDIPTIYEAWNLGVKAARGKYLTNANTDDRHRPDAYEQMVAVLESMPHIDVVYADVFVTWEHNQTYAEFMAEMKGKEVIAGREVGKPGIMQWLEYDRAELFGGCFMGPQPMWRANLHQRYGLFDPEMITAGDYEFWLRVSREDNMYHIPLALGLYCAREDGVELSNMEKSYEESTMAMKKYSAPAMGVNPISPNWVRLSIGSSVIFMEKDFLQQKLGGL